MVGNSVPEIASRTALDSRISLSPAVASTNPVLFSLAIGLILAWRVAGYYGVDRYLLPQLGAPWRPGALFLRHQAQPEAG